MTLKSLFGGAALAAVLASAAWAGPQFVGPNGYANFGYDVVAYHTDFEAVQGYTDYAAEYNGATFLFVSAEHRDLFVADPERFAPAYDGHCAYALTRGKKLTVDPEAFSIVDPETLTQVDPAAYTLESRGVLYLNYSPGVNEKFNRDIPGNLAQADAAWVELEDDPAANWKKSWRDLF